MDGRGRGSAFRIVATYEDQNYQTRVTGWRKVSLPTLSSMEQGWLSGDSDWNWVLDRVRRCKAVTTCEADSHHRHFAAARRSASALIPTLAARFA